MSFNSSWYGIKSPTGTRKYREAEPSLSGSLLEKLWTCRLFLCIFMRFSAELFSVKIQILETCFNSNLDGVLLVILALFFTSVVTHYRGNAEVVCVWERTQNVEELNKRRLGCRAGTKWRKRRRRFQPVCPLIIVGNVRSRAWTFTCVTCIHGDLWGCQPHLSLLHINFLNVCQLILFCFIYDNYIFLISLQRLIIILLSWIENKPRLTR